MALDTLLNDPKARLDPERHVTSRGGQNPLRIMLKPFASLKLTVALFLAAIFLIFVGTLAQTEKDIWAVMNQYFHTWFAAVELRVFVPRAWFGEVSDKVPGFFWFPGGKTIGVAMAINLLAAHGLRFTVQSHGGRMVSGLIVLFFGVLATTAVVMAGNLGEGVQGQPLLSFPAIWTLSRVGLAVVAAAMTGGAVYLAVSRPNRWIEALLLGSTGVVLGLLAGWLIVRWSFYIGDPAMRILYQLLQGGLAGALLLVGCWLVFRKRAGIVLIHGGVLLLMFGEMLVGMLAVEEQIALLEGETKNYAIDIRAVELAIVDSAPDDYDDTIVVPLVEKGSPTRYARKGASYSGQQRTPTQELWDAMRRRWGREPEEVVSLPLTVEVVEFFRNADVQRLSPDESPRATQGEGLVFKAVELKEASGTDNDSVDFAAAYVKLTSLDGEEDYGTFLLSQLSALEGRSERVVVDGRAYDLTLRFKRSYKPYRIKLIDIEKDDYLGTSTPRSYRSDIRLAAGDDDAGRPISISMNNPLRYSGETFYQSGYGPDRGFGESTTLQVVTNTGWMIPYTACMLVLVGLIYHFVLGIVRFLRRRAAALDLPLDSRTTAARASGAGDSAPSAPVVADLVDDSPGTSKPRPTSLPVRGARSSMLKPPRDQMGLAQVLFPMGVVVLASVWMLSQAYRLPTPADEMRIDQFGKLPVVHGGRLQPIDTHARSSLRIISNTDTFVGRYDRATLAEKWSDVKKKVHRKWPAVDEADLDACPQDVDQLIDLVASETYRQRQRSDYGSLTADEREKAEQRAKEAHREKVAKLIEKWTSSRQDATRWLLDVITGSPEAVNYRVFRIENQEVLDTLGLKPRPLLRYSIAEMQPGIAEFEEQVQKAIEKRRKDPKSLSFFEKKLLELDTRIERYILLHRSFRPTPFPRIPTEEEFERDPQAAREAALAGFSAFQQQAQLAERMLAENEPPLAIPVDEEFRREGDKEWLPFAVAHDRTFAPRVSGGEINIATERFAAILDAYAAGDAVEFNRAVAQYHRDLKKNPPDDLHLASLTFEADFNHFAPFQNASSLYLIAFLLATLAWLGWSKPLNNAAFWLIVVTLAVHTVALIARIWISGRPPVTNLYSSAIFIGWGCVVLGLVLEVFYRIGMGNIIAAISGFATLLIAHKLTTSVPTFRGDTIAVMQAVLDTQFWLATHVVCITLGYSATFLAGGLGTLYIVRGMVTPSLTPSYGKDVARMIYGTLCFAILFSFVGTVLGGLWADDSWGRFWGWDPKENGALMIVLWNALVLHARWDGQVKDRGLAVLAVGGNIVTAWSWFGVNELGIGLHSYGFTEGVLPVLGGYVASQIILMGVATIPKDWWWSNRVNRRREPEPPRPKPGLA